MVNQKLPKEYTFVVLFKTTFWASMWVLFLSIACFPKSMQAQCTIPDPLIVSTAPFWNNFDVDGNPVSDEFGILHYFTGSKLMCYSSLVNVYVSAGALVNVADGVAFDGTEDFSGSGEYLDLATGDWQVVFKYIPDGRLGFLNFTVTNDGIEASPDSITVTRYALQNPSDSDGIVAGDCASLDNTALPIELAYFQAKTLNQQVLLEWATASEIDNLGFDIQRGTDGKNFESIGWREGQGYSNQQVTYSFIDDQVRENITYYYRLVNRDRLGGGEKSPLQAARIRGKNSANVSPAFPNPVFGETTNLQIIGQKRSEVQMRLFDGRGQLLRNENLDLEKGPNQFELAVGDLPSGHYYILVDNEGEIARRRFIISR